ncbi:hypothetical protein AV530_008846 [Patagioenas fasciata monilis]|uniref:Tripartite motif-containing protein 15-like n=1 Tax=Patagioenas fasciata monilis TaxID=372326 RepID=A0A1V4K534_PATFA|nr:hypothetical protein AV530_008846 [Patagioenas fasciata monilis]
MAGQDAAGRVEALGGVGDGAPGVPEFDLFEVRRQDQAREKFEAHVRILKDQREKLLGLKEAEEGKSRKCLDRVESERQKLASQFGALRRLLDARERLLLERLGQLGREVARREEEKVNGILGDVAAIDGRIRELEERCRQPPCEFLRDIGAILSRIEEDGAPKPTEPLEPQGPPAAIFPATHVVLKEEALGFRGAGVVNIYTWGRQKYPKSGTTRGFLLFSKVWRLLVTIIHVSRPWF